MKTSTVVLAVIGWFIAAGVAMGSTVMGWVYVTVACISTVGILLTTYGILSEGGKKLAPITYYKMAKDKASSYISIASCLLMAAAVAINGSLLVVIAYVVNWTAVIALLLSLRHGYKSTLSKYTRPDTYSEEE